MKKLISVSTMAIICIMLSYSSFAQKYFAGTVKFETKYEGETNPQIHIPTEELQTIFENKMKTSLYGGAMRTIQDGDSLTITILIDIPQGRIGHTSNREANEEDLLKYSFSYTERTDTKNICGYECKGYDVVCIIDDDEEEETKELKWLVYTTKEIGKDENINAFRFPGLSGYPLYTERESDGVKTITQAKEVKKAKIKALDFLIPSDYRMLTDEQWEPIRKQLSGGK